MSNATSHKVHLAVAPRDAGTGTVSGRAASDGEASSSGPSPSGVEEGHERPLLRVGDLARLTGKTVRAIHHYEQLGLIEPAGRSKGHYRLFDPETPIRIRWISKLKSLGLSLTDIRALVRNRQASPTALEAADSLRRTYEEKLAEVRQRLSELSALETELEASLSYLDSCGSRCAPELSPTECAQCERHPAAEPSDLIVGALV